MLAQLQLGEEDELGEEQERIYEEVRRRPKYLVGQRVNFAEAEKRS